MSLFAQHTTGGAFIKPADMQGHLVIITNVAGQWVREYDQLRQGEVEIATFDYADLNGTEGWQKGVRCNYTGINNKLGNIKGQPGMVLGRIGKVQTNGGFNAFVLAEYSAEDEAYAVEWLASNPAPSAFAAQTATPPAAAALPPLPQAGPPATAVAPVAAPPAPPAAAPAAPAAPQLTPEQLAQMMAALQGQPS